tara:strand:- start:197 stop:856 length:660 start_codon:yes stop_codon:yes gene_type:complete
MYKILWFVIFVYLYIIKLFINKQKQTIMKNLVQLLKTETAELKSKFIEKTKIYAQEEFERINKLSKLNQFELGATMGLKSYIRTENVCTKLYPNGKQEFSPIDCVYPDGTPTTLNFWNHKVSLKFETLERKVKKVSKMGVDKFIANEIKLAIAHYEDSIIKLAKRIMRKDLDLNNIKMETSAIDVNITTTITDGKKSVCAYTIIASGPIQKPHYRYLIK